MYRTNNSKILQERKQKDITHIENEDIGGREQVPVQIQFTLTSAR